MLFFVVLLKYVYISIEICHQASCHVSIDLSHILIYLILYVLHIMRNTFVLAHRSAKNE